MKLILAIAMITINCNTVYSEDSINNIISFRKTLEEHRSTSPAVGISVNSKGEIALGFEGNYGQKKYINVYDNNGKFINGYSFDTSGGYYFKYDNKDNIIIFSIRSGRCYFLDTEAKLIKTQEFSNIDEEESYRRTLLDNKKVMIDGTVYELSSKHGYTKLTKTDADGRITIIYDMGKDYTSVILGRVILTISLILLFLLFRIFLKKP